MYLDGTDLREGLRACVQIYFRSARPEALAIGVPEELFGKLDDLMQEALHILSGRPRVTACNSLFEAVDPLLVDVEIAIEKSIGQRAKARQSGFLETGLETAIIATLQQMLPRAAASYSQALSDLSGPARTSYRGTALELRETVRDVLDHLAPDEEVMASPGFHLESDRNRPTMKQKARFILKARHAPSGAMSAPLEAIDLIDEHAASVARAAYERGSVVTHVPSTLDEVKELKPYVDSVLAELLALHRTRNNDERVEASG